MPELPEVETVCQVLKPVLEGKSFVKAQLNRPDLRYPLPLNLEREIIHQSIHNVRRRAKYLLIEFTHDLTLIWHLGMSGRVMVEDLKNPFIKPNLHDHVIFMTYNHKITYRDPRRFGFIKLLPTKQVNSLNPFHTLGPEPLDDPSFTAQVFHNRLKCRAVSLKSALLDQSIVAGIGNIYASEALWQAKLLPLRLANTLSLAETACLLRELQDVLRRAIAAGGSTLRDHAQPNGDIGYFQHSFKVYNRENALCEHCQLTPIIKITQNGRATYYCKTCQQ